MCLKVKKKKCQKVTKVQKVQNKLIKKYQKVLKSMTKYQKVTYRPAAARLSQQWRKLKHTGRAWCILLHLRNIISRDIF